MIEIRLTGKELGAEGTGTEAEQCSAECTVGKDAVMVFVTGLAPGKTAEVEQVLATPLENTAGIRRAVLDALRSALHTTQKQP